MKIKSQLSKKLSLIEKEYWVKELAKPFPVLDIPTDFSHFNKENMNKSSLSISLDEDLNNDLIKLGTKSNIQAFMLAAYFAWTSRLSTEKDILIGTNINNSIYPIRISMENIKTFQELLMIVNEKLETISNYNFDIDELVPSNDAEDLIQTTFGFYTNDDIALNHTLNWKINQNDSNSAIIVDYDLNLFKRRTIERFIKYYINLIKAVLKEKNTNIYKINIVTEEELEIYNSLNNTELEFPSHKSIPTMFEEAVNKFPNNIAISSNAGQFTYKELNEQANKLANSLIEKGLNKGDFVSIFMERSLETIISILGILKAGGVYVPLDPKHPEDRNTYIISDTKSPFIVTKSSYVDKAKELLSNGLSVKEIILLDNTKYFSTENPNININPTDLAYVIFTSGSTGKPKGTLIAHEGVVNLGCLIRSELNINENEILTQFSTYSFDASVWDTFGSLFWGARLHLLSSEERMSVDSFADAIERTKATFITILPTVFFNQIATHLSKDNFSKLSTVKKVAVGGEALSGEVVRAFQRKFKNSIEIINLYGPTESTVVATGHRVVDLIPEDQAHIPIGKPFSNYEVYIVNEEDKLCPINVPGEILISSVGLAKGYLNQEEKTKEVFVNNPFKDNSIIYRSGDIVRLLENGSIEYVGRKDSQVKILGHRIEIGEIENALEKHPQIQDVAIIPKKDNGETFLVAYYTSKDNVATKASILKSFLQERLPSYMVPKYMNQLDEMPISPTGKIDRKKLATFDVIKIEQSDNYVAPQNETQATIADAWKQVLGLEKISIHDNYFDIGGHSLKIMSILVLLKPRFPDLKIGDFFNYKTVADLSVHIETLQRQSKKVEQKDNNGVWEVKDLNEYPSSSRYKVALNGYITPQNILLTGATGYLGSHILKELLNSTDAKIFCLIRKSGNKTLLEKLLDTIKVYFSEEIIKKVKERVIPIEGDLEKEKLGLSLEDQAIINKNIDTIIHSAADVRHFGDASHFEKVNIQGTKYLLNIAKSKKSVRFHHISTLGIPEDLALSGQWEDVISKENFDNDLSLENVYTNSKLDAEKLVYNAGENGTPVTIYRCGNLTCKIENGQFQKNINSNAFYRVIKSMLLLGKAPKANCYLDFTPIDYASKAIVDLVCKKDTVGETFHICNPNQVLYNSMIDMIRNFGYKIDLIHETDYREWLFNADITKDQEGLELAIAQLEGDGVKDSDYRFACKNTMKHLDSSLSKYRKIDQSFINKMIRHAIKVGYFPQP